MPPSSPPDPLDSLIADIERQCKRISKPGSFTSIEDVRREFVDNTYPAILGVAQEAREIADAQDDAYIMDEELGQTILSALAAGADLTRKANEIAASLDDMNRKRLVELCGVYTNLAEVAGLAVTEAMGYEEGDDAPPAEDDDESVDAEPDEVSEDEGDQPSVG